MERKLTVDDIEVPEGMLDAYEDAGRGMGYDLRVRGDDRRKAMSFALLWLAENPIQPSHKELEGVLRDAHHVDTFGAASVGSKVYGMNIATEWQRRMFLKPAPPVPACVDAGRKALIAAGLSEDDATMHALAIYEAATKDGL